MQILGFVCEKLFRSCFVKVPLLGEFWSETSAVVRGRWWADYMVQGSALCLYVGSTHIVLCPSAWMVSAFTSGPEAVPAT